MLTQVVLQIVSHPIIAIVLLIGILIFIHELGHFLIGRYFGIGVEVFSIGVGPTIFSFEKNKTVFRIALLPLGGYVKFAGMTRNEEVLAIHRGQEMFNASKWARFCTLLAGPMANLLLATVIFMIMLMVGIKQIPAIVGDVLPKSPAEKGGLKAGDLVLSVENTSIKKWDDFKQELQNKRNSPILNVLIKRDEENINLKLIPEEVENKDILGRFVKEKRVGISPYFTPSIVTVTDIKNTSKLKTGDQVTAIWVDGLKKEILYWYQIEKYFKNGATIEINSKEEIQLESLEGIKPSLLTIGDNQDKSIESGVFKYEVLLEVENKKVENWMDFQTFLWENEKNPIKAKVLTKDQTIREVLINLKPVEVQKPEGKKTVFQFTHRFLGESLIAESILEKISNPFVAFYLGLKQTFSAAKLIVVSIWGLITGSLPLQMLGGPILIAKVAQEAVEQGFMTFFHSMAVISVNLGIMNLVPLPALDGGQIALILYEKLRRKNVSEIMLENYQKLGFMLLLALAILATYNDLSRFWSSIAASILGTVK